MYLVVKSIYYFYIRKTNGILNATQLRVLILNIVTGCLLGYAEVLGNRLIDKRLSSGMYLFTYTSFIGCTFAGDIWLTLMYLKVTAQQQNKKIMRHRYTISLIAFAAILLDILLGVVITYGRWSARETLGFALSGALAIGQIVVSFFQIRETLLMVKLLRISETHAKKNQHILQLEKKLRFCVTISFISSIANTVLLIYHSIGGIPYNSTSSWLVVWVLISITHFGSAFAQVHACKPPFMQKVFSRTNAASSLASHTLS